MAVVSFRDLSVWQKSMALAEKCHRLTVRFSTRDQFILGNQIRGAAISIPSNIAEGSGRHYTKEYIHHLRYALASSHELRTQLELATRIGMLSPDDFHVVSANLDEVGKMINGLIRSLLVAKQTRSPDP